ncbi:MAG: hypothetical protein LBL57_00585 [Tannerella sp.]|jgi:hypothetical protein|nr:hypothetical protein [Tannerella sp.]
MKKKSTAKKKSNPVPNPISTSKPMESLDYVIWIFKNIIVGVFAWFMVQYLIDSYKSYDWAYNVLMKENYKTVKKYSHLSLDQKWEAKLGYDFTYWKYLRDNTPEDAVILYPTYDLFFPEGKKSNFKNSASKMHAIRFLHPRKLVYHNERETSRYGKIITHVAIVNGWGYEYLEYPVANKAEITVLPIRQPQN